MSMPDDWYWIHVVGLGPELTIDDIAAYFQSARCGSGFVRSLVYLGQLKTAAMIGIEGMDRNGVEKLTKGSHNISGTNVRVKGGQVPSQSQLQQAITFPSRSVHSVSSEVMQPPLHVQPQVTQPVPVPRPRTKRSTSSLVTVEPSALSTAVEGTDDPPGTENSFERSKSDTVPAGGGSPVQATLLSTDTHNTDDPSDAEDTIERSRPDGVPAGGGSPVQATMLSSPTTTTPLHASSIASESMTPLSPVIKVVGIPPDCDEDMLALAFDDEDEGGGEIEENGIYIKGNEALITFKDPEVAQRVVQKATWEVGDIQVPVFPFQRKLDAAQETVEKCNPDNTIVIDDIPEEVTTGHLLNYLENVTKLDEADDFTLQHKGNKALMVLQPEAAGKLEDSVTRIRTHKKLLEGSRLKASRLTPVLAILATNIRNDMCKEVKLKVYFKNKKKSGGGKVQDVKIIAKGQAIVTFQDVEGVEGVLARIHAVQLGEDVNLQAYHPDLNLWSDTVAVAKRAKAEQKSAVYHKLSWAWYEHIEKCDLLQVVNNQLSDMKLSALAKLDASGTAICIEPTAGSEFDEAWNSQCCDVLQQVLGTVSEASVEIPEDVAGKVFPVIFANTRHPNVSIKLADSQDHVLIIGSHEDAGRLKTTVESIIFNNLDTMKEITLPVSVLVYADQCIRQTLERDNPQVIFKVSLPDGKMHISGKAAGCETFMTEVKKLQPAETVPLLPAEAIQLLSMPHGKQFLHSKLLNSETVSYYFTATDGSILTDDVTPVQVLHIVGPTAQEVQLIVDALQQCITTTYIPVPTEFGNTCRMESWTETKRAVEKHYIALLIPVIERQKIQLVCDTNSVDMIEREIQSFIDRECFTEVCIPVERGQWEFMCEHSKEWNRLSIRIEDAGIEHEFPNMEDPVLTFMLKGETTPVRKHSAAIQAILGSIVKEKTEVVRPGTVKHFQSEQGILELKGVGAEWKAVVEVTTLEEEKEEAVLMEQVAQPTHRTVCSGDISGNKKVEIMVGDLTEFPVDVIVNPANTDLQHGGGLAGLIARKGGHIIQQESTQYITRHGSLDVGEAVLMKSVGNLHCKAIVHAVGPKWADGKENEEAYLTKAVEGSLMVAKNYKSIGFPAISSGIYAVPLDVCARGIFTGIRNFFHRNPQCNIKVIIMLNQDSHGALFDKAADQFLQNVSRPRITTPSVSPVHQQAPVNVPRKPSPPKGTKRQVLSQATPQKGSDAIVLRKGSLTDHKVDVYVNTAASSLDLSYGAVANSLRKSGGPKLQEECTQYTQTNGDTNVWSFVTTGGHKLNCKHVIHTVGGNHDGPGGMAEEGMKTMLFKVMEECDRLNATSVAFPALGTGALGFPDNVVADIMVNTVSAYLEQQKGKTTIKKVVLVIFQDKTHKAFKKVMKKGHAASRLSSKQQVHPSPSTASDMEEYDIVSDESLVSQQNDNPLFKCNNMTLDIVHGDISADNCDGIVNTTSENLILRNFGVQGALLHKGGQALQSECTAAAKLYGKLSPGKVIVTGPGKVGGLQCRKILHILAPPREEDLVRTVNEALQMADREGLKSVALPAIGTGQHGFSPQDAAKSICEAIVSFSKSNPSTLNHIRIVLFEKKLFSEFTQHFEESGKEKGVIRAILGTVGGWLSAVTSALSRNSPSTDQEYDASRDTECAAGGALHPIGQGPLKRVHSYSESTVLVVSVYAGSQQTALNAVAQICRIIDQTIVNEEVNDELIHDLPTADEENLQDFAKQLHVRLTIDRATINKIKIRGDKVDVAVIKGAVMDSLFKLKLQKKRKTDAILMSGNFQWQWKDSQGQFQNYEPLVNLEIEEAYNKGDTYVDVETEDGPRQVDIRNMTETSQFPPSTSEVRRRDLEKEIQVMEREMKEGERPSTWDPMPIDSSTGREVLCHVVELDASNPEYKEVEQAFCRTMGDVGTLHSCMSLPYQGIIKIRRIQNQKLYSQYTARKKFVEKSNPEGKQNEQQLFHGCDVQVTDDINHEGLNRSFAGKHATKYGRGVYFAKEAYYSARDLYTPRDSNGYKHVYYARVLTGQYAQGKEDMLVPPPKDPNKPSVLCESVVDDMQDPFIFVVFQDAYVYPEYLITFH